MIEQKTLLSPLLQWRVGACNISHKEDFKRSRRHRRSPKVSPYFSFLLITKEVNL
ncbi:hypothetical protein Scep_017721 [Stephania cephalantha]|uniref:Uncharacterized protein n=1 Tax=Stephania cephalantha TaxID=152367 RepID=A0AAP0IRE4_9MAGN